MIRYRSGRSKCILILIVCLIVASPPHALAQNGKSSKKELENRKRKISEEIRQLNAQLSETKVSKKTSLGALVKINIRLQKRQELINTINAEIAVLEGDIRTNETQIAQLKSNLARLKQEYARMIVFAQRHQDSYSTLMFIFASESFAQAYQRLKYMQQYTVFRKQQAVEIINTQTALLARLNALRDQRIEKSTLLGSQVVEKRLLSSEKAEHEQVLTGLQQREKDLKKQLQKKKDDAARLQVAIRKLIEDEIRRKAEEARKARAAKALAEKKAREERKKNAAKGEKPLPEPSKESGKPADKDVPELSDEAVALSADFANNRGKLPWPVVKGVICETYGEHEHPAIKGFMMFNNGLEICASKGSQARAVFDGEVTGIAVSPMGGNLVIIRHGEYLSVYSNIGEVLVKTGQKVTVRQPIGSVMYDEDEDKTSMNLQIWKGQKTMDPGGWLLNGR